MATIPTAYTWTVGELLTAAKANAYIRDAVSFLLSPPYALLNRSSDQSILNTTATNVNWNSELADSDGGHSTSANTDRYAAQTAGLFSLDCSIPWPANATGVRELTFLVNATTGYAGSRPGPNGNVSFVVAASRKIPLSVGDYVVARVYQSSGGSLSIDQSYSGGPLLDILWCRT